MSEKNLLEIKDLHVNVEDKEILHGVNLEVGKDEVHVLMGPNGTGKSTLGYAITGHPKYAITSGQIFFDGEDITEMPVNERAKKGIFLSFQNPLEVPGVTLSAFIRNALEQKTGKRVRLWDFKKKLTETMKLLSMDESYAERDLNVGFSGGEKKKAEILQMLLLNPKLARIQTEGGICQGIGLAMYEDVQYSKKGKMMTNSFMQYKIPSRMDIGHINVEFESSYENAGPFGAKSIGEVVINTPLPAITDALSHAAGKRFYELPITPDQIAMASVKDN